MQSLNPRGDVVHNHILDVGRLLVIGGGLIARNFSVGRAFCIVASNGCSAAAKSPLSN
jgi:hypothetical protein